MLLLCKITVSLYYVSSFQIQKKKTFNGIMDLDLDAALRRWFTTSKKTLKLNFKF